MKIIHILPGLIEGGVERHVLMLSDQLVKNGHRVMVISSGGKLVDELNPKVDHWLLPVHRKDPVTALVCALKISRKMRSEKWDLVHAHSRVPAWIAWWASRLTKKPFVVTANSLYSLNAGLFPFRKADIAICGSQSIQDHLEGYLPGNSKVIYNGLLPPDLKWAGVKEDKVRFLFIGRLTKLKGLRTVIEALPGIKSQNWVLDVAGIGPQREPLEKLVYESGLSEKVLFHGFVEDTDLYMRKCSCFLFPSLSEGMGLTLMRAIQTGVPVIASDLPPVRELTDRPDTLVSAGNVEKWRVALEDFLRNGKVSEGFKEERIPSVTGMVERVESEIYLPLLRKNQQKI